MRGRERSSQPGDAGADHEHVTAPLGHGDRAFLDGRPDEPAWLKAELGSGFTQFSPDEGAPPSVQTRFRVLWDDDAIYVGVECDDAEPPTAIKLYEYQYIGERSNIIFGKRVILRRLELLLPEVALPVRLHEFRALFQAAVD